jgi:formate dehydrogenase subunit gamma
MSLHKNWDAQRAAPIIAAHVNRPGGLLPLLHDLQAEFGMISDEASAAVALALNLSRADVLGVVSFYHDFRHEPAGRTVMKLCRAEACQARGGERIAAHAEARVGVTTGQTTPDGRITLEAVYCLGLCASGPAALIDGALVARIDERRLDLIIAEVAA